MLAVLCVSVGLSWCLWCRRTSPAGAWPPPRPPLRASITPRGATPSAGSVTTRRCQRSPRRGSSAGSSGRARPRSRRTGLAGCERRRWARPAPDTTGSAACRSRPWRGLCRSPRLMLVSDLSPVMATWGALISFSAHSSGVGSWSIGCLLVDAEWYRCFSRRPDKCRAALLSVAPGGSARHQVHPGGRAQSITRRHRRRMPRERLDSSTARHYSTDLHYNAAHDIATCRSGGACRAVRCDVPLHEI